MVPLSPSATDELWLHMASRYGHAWVSQFGPAPDGIAAAEWRSTLAGLTREQLREGFEADVMRGDDWPPSSPKFLAMCLGIPSIASVRHEIEQMLRWSDHSQGSLMSRFARGVWTRIDGYTYRSAPAKLADRMLREAFDLTREFVMEGGTLPVQPAGLVEHQPKERKPADPAVVKQHIDKLAEMLKIEPAKPHTEVDDEPDAAA